MPKKRTTSSKSASRITKGDFRGLSAGEKRAQSRIVFTKGDRNGRGQRRVRRTLRDSFTQEELKAMGEVEVEFGPVKSGNRAEFYRKTKPGDVIKIKLDPKQLEDDDIVHEFVHALKAEDKSRTGYAATLHHSGLSRKNTDLSNIEEATVVAEAAIRTSRPAKTPSGYFEQVPGVGSNPVKMKRAYDEDRLILLGAPPGANVKDSRGIRGKAAVNKLNRNFSKTSIAKKRIAGRSALTSYNRLKKK